MIATTAGRAPDRSADEGRRPTAMARGARLRYLLRWAGPVWTLLYLVRQVLGRVVYRLNRRMMRIEERRFLTGEMTVSAEHNTAERNSRMWNQYDWSRRGEEWSEQATVQRGIDADAWKRRLVAQMLEKYMPENGALLEVGPGGGRWTEFLLPRSRRLILVDVAERCLELCRDRFGADSKLEYCLVTPGAQRFIDPTAVADGSVDGVWSYDAFVHINPTDIATYLADFGRILRPGGAGVIHHTGRSPNDRDYEESFRSQMNAGFFAHLLAKHGLELVEQNDALVHRPGDVITVFRKPVRPR